MNKILLWMSLLLISQICLANVQQEINYDLGFSFEKNKNSFQGHAIIEVKLKDTFEDLKLSFKGKINSVVVNNQSLKNINPNAHFFSIPKNHLSLDNKIEIAFSGSFDTDIISKIEVGKDKTVVYTGKSYKQKNQIFPTVMDQTLPSKIKLKITSPKEWKTTTNSIKETETYLKDMKTIRFKETEKIELDSFHFIAGDLEVDSQFHNEISLNIYHSKKGLKNELSTIFHQIKNAIDYFSSYTGTTFPLKKIDFVFLPINKTFVLEGRGINIFNDNNFFTDQNIYYKDFYLASSVLKSWNNLPEEFISYLTNQFNKKNYDISTLPLKREGYVQSKEDITTKDEYKNQFSILQLNLLVGESAFTKAINYQIVHKLKKEDILKSFKPFTRVNLDSWKNEWQRSFGTNKVKISFSCANGKIKKFNITQSPNESGLLQTHTTTIGLFTYLDSKLNKILEKQVTFNQALNDIKEFRSHPCPEFVHPDYENKDYAIYELDSVSSKNLATFLPLMPSEASRFNLIVMSEEMVRNETLSPMAFFEALLHVFQRKNSDVFLQYLRQTSIVDMYYHYITSKERSQLGEKFEGALGNAIKESNSLEVKFRLLSWYLQLGRSEKFKKHIETGLKSGSLFNVTLDSASRWRIIRFLENDDLMKSEAKLDRSPLVASQVAATKIAKNTPDSKKEAWKELTDPQSFRTLDQMKVNIALFFHHPDHPELSLNFVDDYFSIVSNLKTDNPLVLQLFFNSLYPHTLCQNDVYQKSKMNREKSKTLNATALKMWEKAENELALCTRIRSKN